MIQRLALSVASFCVVAGACSDPLSPELAIEIRTDRESYALGESGVAMITNHSDEPLTVPWCGYRAEFRVESEWVVRYDSYVCTLQGIAPIQPGETRAHAFTVAGSRFPEPGEYRVRTSVWDYDCDTNAAFCDLPVFSNAFAVTVD
jgi:hypothetical protein